MPDYLSVAQVAKRLGITRRQVLRRIDAGTLIGEKLDPEAKTSAYILPAEQFDSLSEGVDVA